MKELIKKALSVDDKLTKFLDEVFKPWIEENTTLDEDGRERLSFYFGAMLAGFMSAKDKAMVDDLAMNLFSAEMLTIILMSLELSAKLAGGMDEFMKKLGDSCDGDCDSCSGD